MYTCFDSGISFPLDCVLIGLAEGFYCTKAVYGTLDGAQHPGRRYSTRHTELVEIRRETLNQVLTPRHLQQLYTCGQTLQLQLEKKEPLIQVSFIISLPGVWVTYIT